MTVASAWTLVARGGSTAMKSIRKWCLPAGSVRPWNVSTLGGSPSNRVSHHGVHSPNVKSSRFGGVNEPGVAATRHVTSAPVNAPPA